MRFKNDYCTLMYMTQLLYFCSCGKANKVRTVDEMIKVNYFVFLRSPFILKPIIYPAESMSTKNRSGTRTTYILSNRLLSVHTCLIIFL